jgi:hypothetical protein
MALNADWLEAIALGNVKAMSEFAVQNSIAHQNRLQILAEKALAKSLESMDTLQISEAIGPASLARSQIQDIIAAITGAVSSAQQLVKTAQTTPPVTP